jgi:hypothetical protein
VLASALEWVSLVEAGEVAEPGLAAGSAVVPERPSWAVPAVDGSGEARWADVQLWAEEHSADALPRAEECWADVQLWAVGCSAAGQSCWAAAHQGWRQGPAGDSVCPCRSRAAD